MVNEQTQLKFSDFYETKNGMVEPTYEKMHKWKEAGKPVKYLRMDNAGENVARGKRAESAERKLNL